VSPVAQETQARTESQVTLVLPVFLVSLVAHRWSAKNPTFLLATRAHPELQDQLEPEDPPEIKEVLAHPAIQETLVLQDPSDPLDPPDPTVLPAPLDPLVGLARQQSARPIPMEMLDNPEMPAQKDPSEMPAHKDPLATPAHLATREHPVHLDPLEAPAPMETLAPQEIPATKENEANVPNTAVWMVESSSKMEPESEHDNNDPKSISLLLNTFLFFLVGFNCFYSVLDGSFRNLSKTVCYPCTFCIKYLVLLANLELIIPDRSKC